MAAFKAVTPGPRCHEKYVPQKATTFIVAFPASPRGTPYVSRLPHSNANPNITNDDYELLRLSGPCARQHHSYRVCRLPGWV